MKTLDDSWNSQDLKVFRQRHAKDGIVRWPNQPPTNGIEAHEQEALAFFKTFPDQHLVNNPYKVRIAQGDWTCTIAEFTGTMTGPMTMADGTVIGPRPQECQTSGLASKRQPRAPPRSGDCALASPMPRSTDGLQVSRTSVRGNLSNSSQK
jgi:hypothetical protein